MGSDLLFFYFSVLFCWLSSIFTCLFFRYSLHTTTVLYFPGGTSGHWTMQGTQETQVRSWVGETPGRRVWQPTQGSLPGESHGQRSLAGCSPWGHRESDTAEATEQHTHPNIYLFKVHDRMICSIFTRVCDHHCLACLLS